MTEKLSSSVGIRSTAKGFEVSIVGTRWKLISVLEELGRDVMRVIMHSLKYHIGCIFRGIPSDGFITMDFLYPLQIDYRHNTDQKINILNDIVFISYQTAM